MAALPAAALTAALAVGVGYFAGGSTQDAQVPPGSVSQFKFDSGPQFAPGSRQAAPSGQAVSSIDMFQKANENYSAETAAAPQEPSAKRPRDKKALQEFLKQVRHDINMDPAALAEAEAAAAQQEGGAGRMVSNPAARGARAEQQAGATAVQGRQGGGAAAAAKAGSLKTKNSAFSSGRAGRGLSGGSGGLRQPRGIGSGFGGEESGGGAGQDTDYAESSAGRSLEAGAYGSHGGGGASSPQMAGEGSSAGGGMKAGGGEKTEKKIPAPVIFVWPRTFEFGDMYAQETAARQVVVMNIGDAAMKIGKIENMDEETPFTLENDKCSRSSLAPGKSCTFRVRFSPKAVNEYVTGFEVPTDDGGAMSYQGIIEVKGNAKYSYSAWWWSRYGSGPAGFTNRLNFGLVPEGYAMDEVLRVTNTSGAVWEDIKLDTSKLPAAFRISGDGCTGGNLGPRHSCAVTVTFTPSAAVNRQFSSSYYGQYHAVNLNTGAKLYHSRPAFPPLALERPVEAAPSGKLLVRAHYGAIHTGQVVAEIPVKAESSGPFPVVGLARIQHYYFFK